MDPNKSGGVTPTERELAAYCEDAFLGLWSYPNPFKSDGKELCDLLAVFDRDVFVFFDRMAAFPEASEDFSLAWKRWKRRAVDRQIITASGAERYLRRGGKVYLDSEGTKPFPITIPDNARFHKVVVAHGARDACLSFSDANTLGSLAISYGDALDEAEWPFHIRLDRQNPVHVLDSENFGIVLGELDTVADLASYFNAKEEAIARYDALAYCGEEDLLAHYLNNFEDSGRRHFIGVSDADINFVMIGEGEWKSFVRSETYRLTKEANRVSYFWDDLIRKTAQNFFLGTLGGNSQLQSGPSAVREMAREPRFVRRELSEKMLTSVRDFPDAAGGLMRNVNLMPSFYSGCAYVFLQLHAGDAAKLPDHPEKRRAVLELACGAAKNRFPELHQIVGIAIDAPKYHAEIAEDFLLMPCADWSSESRHYYETQNSDWKFFQTSAMKKVIKTAHEFVTPFRASTGKGPGRNAPCHCGSGRKFKKCCLR
jgi:hypothetical protein